MEAFWKIPSGSLEDGEKLYFRCFPEWALAHGSSFVVRGFRSFRWRLSPGASADFCVLLFYAWTLKNCVMAVESGVREMAYTVFFVFSLL